MILRRAWERCRGIEPAQFTAPSNPPCFLLQLLTCQKGREKQFPPFSSSAALSLGSKEPCGAPCNPGNQLYHGKALLMQWVLLTQAPTPSSVLAHTSNQAAKCPQGACDTSRKHKTQVRLQDVEERGPAGGLCDPLGWSSCSPVL